MRRLEDSCCCSSSLVLREKQPLPLLQLLDVTFFFSFFLSVNILCYATLDIFSFFSFLSLSLSPLSLSGFFSSIVEENNFSSRKNRYNTAFIETCQHVIKIDRLSHKYCLLISNSNRTNVNKYSRASPTHHIIFKYAREKVNLIFKLTHLLTRLRQ